MNMTKVKETAIKLFTGEITVPKRELWLAGAVCLLAGIVIGIVKAPWTHGVMIGSNNGNNSGNTNTDCSCSEEECECVGECEV